MKVNKINIVFTLLLSLCAVLSSKLEIGHAFTPTNTYATGQGERFHVKNPDGYLTDFP